MRPTRGQLELLVLLTLVWGLNWPVMKFGVSGTPAVPVEYPPLTFRMLSMWLGLPVLAAALRWLKVPLYVPRGQRAEIVRLALPNMVVWHVLAIVAIQSLSSGRAAILGYTMPVFSALWGLALWRERLRPWQLAGVAAAALGVVLLLWGEFSRLAGAPWAALAMLVSACVWALGTHMLRRSRTTLHVLTIAFWMTAITAVVMTVLAWTLERDAWRWPSLPVTWAIAYNAVGVFAFAQAAWFTLARALPPVASTISVMLIPVLGTFAGAWALGEAVHGQDLAAMVLMVLAIGAVLWRRPPASPDGR
jgi:drug/metabolite transporter (DMT)-like permease